MRALSHAGCGGSITAFARGMWCIRCYSCISDSLELMPRGGWRPDPADRSRVLPVGNATEEAIEA